MFIPSFIGISKKKKKDTRRKEKQVFLVSRIGSWEVIAVSGTRTNRLLQAAFYRKVSPSCSLEKEAVSQHPNTTDMFAYAYSWYVTQACLIFYKIYLQTLYPFKAQELPDIPEVLTPNVYLSTDCIYVFCTDLWKTAIISLRSNNLFLNNLKVFTERSVKHVSI